MTSDERITWPSQLDSTCCKVPPSNPQPRTPCTNPEQHKLLVLSSESIPRLLWSCQSHVLLWFFEGVFSLTGREFRGFPSTTSAHTTKSIFELQNALLSSWKLLACSLIIQNVLAVQNVQVTEFKEAGWACHISHSLGAFWRNRFKQQQISN